MNKFIIIGLGNPGEKYKETRHNAGKRFVRWMAKSQGELELVETECFMNESGSWLKSQLNRLTGRQVNRLKKPASLFICHDDLDIPLGSFKIQFGKGPRLHKGILSIEQVLGTKEFWRVRIGIDNRLTGQQVNRLKNADSGEEYVLEKFKPAEKKVLEAVFPEIRSHLLKLVN